ncbi:MAG TPA: hypothetical protein VFG71_09495, partial [Nitrospiraceae bacterium]|nr:hypothetical protein [Nitrospiraceae bacterium]
AKKPHRFAGLLKSRAPVTPTPRVLEQFSPESLRVAETVGVLPLLNDLADLNASRPDNIMGILVRRQLLTERTQLALLEIASTTAEIICERDRADQLADRIDEIDGARIKQLTIGSIVLGGIAAIVTGGIGLAGGVSTAADASTVGGGVLASWLGVSALFVQSEVELHHDRNILSELWDDPDEPEIFSPIVWRYLHRSPDSTRESPRTEVLNAWRQKGRLGQEGTDDEQQRRELFFSAGGRYASPELRARASMLETLEASLRLMHEELEVLIREVSEMSESFFASPLPF